VTPTDEQVASLVAEFQADLKKMSDGDVVHKHILTGMPVVVPDHAYFEIRRRTAHAFAVCPSEILIVGSCRTGFSIKDGQTYKPARPDSDIDVTIVSERLFQEYWEAVFRFANSSYEYRQSNQYKIFSQDLARGWIMPRGLPRMQSFSKWNDWFLHFDELGRQRLHGSEPRNINGKLYRSWISLQTYQEILVRKRRNEITRPKR
jgi:hypothetical protein